MRTLGVLTITTALMAVSAIGTVAQEAEIGPAEPVEFTAKWSEGAELAPGTKRLVDGAIVSEGESLQVSVLDTSDPRLDGTGFVTSNHTIYGGVGGPEVWLGGFRIENDEGAWQEIASYGRSLLPQDAVPTSSGVFVGEGTYDGYFLIADIDKAGTMSWDVHGYIIEGVLPDAPAQPAE